MIVETVFLSIFNHMDFHLVQNRKENCHHDHILWNFKENENLFFLVYYHGTAGHQTIMNYFDTIKKFNLQHIL